jgi:large subunit ribosomal protein L28
MVSHAHNVSKRRWQPNLQCVRVVIDGVPQKINVCTGCLKSDVVQKAIRSTAKTPAQKETTEP